MGRTLHYRPGSFYRTDDRTGFPQRAENTRKQWNNLIVDESVWEPRQPQDLVKGVKDDQTVNDARPLAPNQFVGPLYLSLSSNSSTGDTFIQLSSLAGVTVGDEIAIMLDTNVLYTTGVQGFSDGGVLIFGALPSDAASGNMVIDYRTPFAGAFPSGGILLTEEGAILTAEGGGFILLEA